MAAGASRAHFLPDDGQWHRAPWWREVSAECAAPEVVAEAEQALLAVFSPDWAHDLVMGEAGTHPFEREFHQRAGIAKLLKLGYSLSLLGSPAQLVADLAEPTRFATRTSEAWAGAFVKVLGASVEYLEERPHVAARSESGPRGPIPEFIASLDETRFAVEVKHLDMGKAEKEHMMVERAFSEGLLRGENAGGAERLANAGSRAIHSFPPEILLALENEDFVRARELAAERGREIGRAYVDFVASGPGPGRWSVMPGLEVLIGTEYSGAEGSFPFPGLSTYINRLRRNQLAGSVKKFRACGLPGIIVLFRPWWPMWPRALIDEIERILGQSEQLDCVAGVAFVDEAPEPGMRWLKDRIEVIPGPAWGAMPAVLREHFQRCGGCGRRHQEFELLRHSAHART